MTKSTADPIVTFGFEDDMWWAEVAELPGCFASGATLRELSEALDEAVRLYQLPPATPDSGEVDSECARIAAAPSESTITSEQSPQWTHTHISRG